MKILICNFKTDNKDDLLGFTHDWIEEFSCHFEEVFVISSEVGDINLPKNVKVFSMGVEKSFNKIKRFAEFYKIVGRLLKSVHIDACFVHMAQHLAIMAWPIFRLHNIPIVLWYAHRATPLTLKIAEKMADSAVSCSAEGFQIKSGKLKVIGHGISEKKFQFQEMSENNEIFTILSLSRFSEIKNIDVLIKAFAILRKKHELKLKLVGRAHTKSGHIYEKKIRKLVDDLALNSDVEFAGSIPNNQVPEAIKNCEMTVNLFPTGSLDKAVLEAMAVGRPTIIVNKAFEPLLNEANVAQNLFLVEVLEPEKIAETMEKWLIGKDKDENREILARLSEFTRKRHGLKSTIKKIAAELKRVAEHGS